MRKAEPDSAPFFLFAIATRPWLSGSPYIRHISNVQHWIRHIPFIVTGISSRYPYHVANHGVVHDFLRFLPTPPRAFNELVARLYRNLRNAQRDHSRRQRSHGPHGDGRAAAERAGPRRIQSDESR